MSFEGQNSFVGETSFIAFSISFGSLHLIDDAPRRSGARMPQKSPSGLYSGGVNISLSEAAMAHLSEKADAEKSAALSEYTVPSGKENSASLSFLGSF